MAELLAHSNSIQLQTFTRNCDSAEEEKPSKQAIQLWTNTVQNKNSPIKVKKVANNTASLPGNLIWKLNYLTKHLTD